MVVRADILQQCAHNGVVAGSNPAGPTTQSTLSIKSGDRRTKARGAAGFGRLRVDGRQRSQLAASHALPRLLPSSPNAELSAAANSRRARSSAGQNAPLITAMSQVRVLPGPPFRLRFPKAPETCVRNPAVPRALGGYVLTGDSGIRAKSAQMTESL